SQVNVAIDIQTFSKFPDLAKYILEQISLKEKKATISTQKIIKILHETVEGLASKLSKESAEEMEDVFRTVLDYEEEEKTAESVLKSAAAYLLVNQILFYHRLVKETASYPEIEPENLHSGEDLQKNYFNHVLRVDYKSIFGFDVALTIGKGEPLDSLKTAISAIQLLPIESITHDLLGKIFHNLIPLSLRKVVAAYYTNSEAAELLAHLAVEREDAKVIDPACGSGTLLVAAYNAKRERAKSEKAETHIRFLEKEIYGCDIMTFAAHLSAVNLALQAPLKFTNKVNVAIRDSTELAPGIEIESAQEVIRESQKIAKLSDFDFENGSRKTTLKKVKKGVIDLLDETRGVKLPKFDVVIMNPPFTRFQRIPKEYKKKLAERFSSLRYKNIVHGQMGLHGYFLLLADKLLAPGGRIAAVLPLTTISLEGFYGVVKLLLSDYQIEHIIVSSGRAAFSENTSLREILLVAKKEKPIPETQTKFTFIHASAAELTVEKAKEIAEKIRDFDGDDEYNNDFYIRSINQYNFNSEIRSLYRTVTLSTPQLVKVDEKLTKWFKPGKKFCRLEDVEKNERWSISENPRGVETKGYYVLSLLSGRGGAERILKDHDVWIIEEETEQLLKVKQRFSGQIFKIPKNCVVPQFRRFSGEKHISLNGPRDYLIVRKFDDLDNFVKASGIANDAGLKNIRTSIREGAWEQFVVK
ncbi:MAG: N-6 DNA methylase, partial [Minisyncoccia bacterium]